MSVKFDKNISVDDSGKSKTYRRVSTSASFSVNSVLKILCLLVLFFSFCSLLFGHGYRFGLQSLLEALTSLPEVNLSTFLEKVTIPSITSDWGAFNFFRAWINNITSTLNGLVAFIGFFGVGFVQLFDLLKALLLGL